MTKKKNQILPYFQKTVDTVHYTIYESLDNKHRTIYNKDTYELTHITDNKVYKHKKDF